MEEEKKKEINFGEYYKEVGINFEEEVENQENEPEENKPEDEKDKVEEQKNFLKH